MSIKNNIDRLRSEIAEVCARIGRNPAEIIVVAASKYVGADGVIEAREAGLENFGENRVQDALDKIEACPDDLHWHFIGHLQRNKVTKVVGVFENIHSVDSDRLAMKIDQIAREYGIIQNIMIEVNLSDEESKFGLETEEVSKLAERILALDNIRLTGFMTMAPFVDDEEIIRNVFRGLRRLRDDLQSRFGTEIPFLSMGMTNDWRIAIEEGATHLRIGSAIFKAQ